MECSAQVPPVATGRPEQRDPSPAYLERLHVLLARSARSAAPSEPPTSPGPVLSFSGSRLQVAQSAPVQRSRNRKPRSVRWDRGGSRLPAWTCPPPPQGGSSTTGSAPPIITAPQANREGSPSASGHLAGAAGAVTSVTCCRPAQEAVLVLMTQQRGLVRDAPTETTGGNSGTIETAIKSGFTDYMMETEARRAPWWPGAAPPSPSRRVKV